MASTASTTTEPRPNEGPAARGPQGGAAARESRAPDARAQSRMLLFEVGGRIYACGIDAVREIIPFRPCTRLPGAPSFVCGLINLRGTITTVLDLAARLDAGTVDRQEGSIVLAEHGSKVVGIGVDRVRDVQPIPPDDIEPATGDETRGGIVRGLARVDDQVVVLLDVPQLVRQALL